MKKLLTVSLAVALLAVASLAAQAPAGTQASKAAKWTPPGLPTDTRICPVCGQ